MRSTLRLLATLKPKTLTAGAPTGLTGLYTHPSPRSALLYLYSSTLDTLSQLPSHSIYRQSTEALTKSRKSTVESVKPDGFDAWLERSRQKIAQDPEKFEKAENIAIADVVGARFVNFTNEDEKEREWDGEQQQPTLEGPRRQPEADYNSRIRLRNVKDMQRTIDWEPEPSLSTDQSVPELSHCSSLARTISGIVC